MKDFQLPGGIQDTLEAVRRQHHQAIEDCLACLFAESPKPFDRNRFALTHTPSDPLVETIREHKGDGVYGPPIFTIETRATDGAFTTTVTRGAP